MQAARTTDFEAARGKLREMPIDTPFTQGATIRDDGRVMRPMYVVHVMAPAESSGPTSRGRDGRLAVVSRDLSTTPFAGSPTMQAAMDDWNTALPGLQRLSQALDAGTAPGAFAFDPAQAAAIMPRAYQWLDASAFIQHGALMMKALKMERNPQGATPLIYQGASDDMLGALDDVPFVSEAHGIDFEGEFAVILGDTPMAATAEPAASSIRLLVLLNDWGLRRPAPAEMSAGFGWMQSKTATSLGPGAVTPDELGAAWRDWRIHLPLRVTLNGKTFGTPHAGGMHFNFIDLICHVAATRRLGAGTILGAGTVSEGDPDRVGSACIVKKQGQESITMGEPVTPFMNFGDCVRIEMLDEAGRTIFGAIDQRVVPAGAAGS